MPAGSRSRRWVCHRATQTIGELVRDCDLDDNDTELTLMLTLIIEVLNVRNHCSLSDIG
jgi:hypothetical protein